MVIIKDVTNELSVGVKVSNEKSEELNVDNVLVSESLDSIAGGEEENLSGKYLLINVGEGDILCGDSGDDDGIVDTSDDDSDIIAFTSDDNSDIIGDDYDDEDDDGSEDDDDDDEGEDDDDDDDDDAEDADDVEGVDDGEDADDVEGVDDGETDDDNTDKFEGALEIKKECEENDTRQFVGNDIVGNVLAREAEALKAISVTKAIELEYDLGTLLAVDNNNLDFAALRNSREKYLHKLAQDNTQLLINKIWQLPIKRENTDILAELPAPTYKLPREKPVPKPKTPTKWELFSAKKGIVKTKKKRVQWDETLQKWVPWWGYRKVKAEKEKNWAIEVRGNDDPNEDPFAKITAQKQERVAKNEYQRLRNLALDKNVKIPRENAKKKVHEKKVPKMGLLSGEYMSSKELKAAVTLSKSSTGSLGNFQRKLPKEKTVTNVNSLMPMATKKRKRLLSPNEEKTRLLETFSILQKKPKLNVDKAVNQTIHQQEHGTSKKKKSGKSKGKAKPGKRPQGKEKGGKIRGRGKQNKTRAKKK